MFHLKSRRNNVSSVITLHAVKLPGLLQIYLFRLLSLAMTCVCVYRQLNQLLWLGLWHECECTWSETALSWRVFHVTTAELCLACQVQSCMRMRLRLPLLAVSLWHKGTLLFNLVLIEFVWNKQELHANMCVFAVSIDLTVILHDTCLFKLQ
jgi:hypothetical protein